MLFRGPYIISTLILLLSMTSCLDARLEVLTAHPQQTANNPVELKTTAGTLVSATHTVEPTAKQNSTSISRSNETPIPSSSSLSGVYEINCFPLEELTDQARHSKSYLLLNGSYFNNSIVVPGDNGQITTIANPYTDWLINVLANPSRTHIAIKMIKEGDGKSELQIIDRNAAIIARFDWGTNWRQIAGWLNDRQVIISVKNDDNTNDDSLLLDFFSGERVILESKYPYLWLAGDLSPRNTWKGNTFTGVYYHPSLKYVVYSSNRKGIGLVLSAVPEGFQFDRTKSYEIAHMEGDFGSYPKWSPDGSVLAVLIKPPELPKINADQKELFTVSLDGEVTQRTFFNRHQLPVSIQEVSWSPDGKKIAFLMLNLQNQRYTENYPDVQSAFRLAILDLTTGIATDTCVPGDNTPVWSSDSQFIAVTHVYNRSSPSKGHLYLVDIQKQSSYSLFDDYFPEAWIEEKQ